ncbi:MAG: FkbM family methyltransferase [Clostridia bacterium]|nr:FkbM family methyltransferase [Clostridia bacterium]
MIERIKEKNVWDYLKETDLPIVLYGMGNGTDMVMQKLDEIGVTVADIFASDEFVRGHYFRGFRVMKYSEICEKYTDFVIVVCFAVHDSVMLGRIKQLSQKHPLFAPNVPIVDDGVFTREFIEEHDEEFERAYSLLSDEFSRQSFIDVLNFKVSGKVEYLFKCEKQKAEIYSEYLKLNENEIFMDLGAYDGDTVREFLQATGGRYNRIIAVEADEKNYRKLTDKTAEINNITTYNLAAWDKKETLFFEKKKGRNSKLSSVGKVEVQADSVDNILCGEKITVLKMDIEGSEEKALEGARQTVVNHRPKLYVCAYHRNSDMFRLPLKIHELCTDYRIYFCHHPYIPAWESNFYCIVDYHPEV